MSTRYPNLCRSFAEEACRVWEDMSDAHSLGVARQEETTTEELLLSLARKHKGKGLDIESFTRSDETSNGADWAFWVTGSHGLGIELRIQAKRLYPKSGRYESLFHQSPSQKKTARLSGGDTPNQCETLIANHGRAIPIYVFYNSDALEIDFTKTVILAICSFASVSRPEVWGISVASAYAIKTADWGKRNRPKELPMMPWHLLVCSCFWPDRPSDPSLPALIGNALRHLFQRGGADYSEAINFDPHDYRPEWVGLLREGREDNEQLLNFMRETNLKGVAEISERPIDE
jgi:hypothetical protein